MWVMMTIDRNQTITIIIVDARVGCSWSLEPPLLGCELATTRLRERRLHSSVMPTSLTTVSGPVPMNRSGPVVRV
jgi:hypothetical protein